jgi:hypothetical protein
LESRESREMRNEEGNMQEDQQQRLPIDLSAVAQDHENIMEAKKLGQPRRGAPFPHGMIVVPNDVLDSRLHTAGEPRSSDDGRRVLQFTSCGYSVKFWRPPTVMELRNRLWCMNCSAIYQLHFLREMDRKEEEKVTENDERQSTVAGASVRDVIVEAYDKGGPRAAEDARDRILDEADDALWYADQRAERDREKNRASTPLEINVAPDGKITTSRWLAPGTYSATLLDWQGLK